MWRIVSVAGKVVGILASVVMSILDFLKSRSEFREGDFAVAAAYFVSGLAGIVLAFAILAAYVFIAVVAFVALILSSIFVLGYSDNARHDWLERCLWGRLEGQKYPDAKVEVQEYRIALGAA